MGASNSYFGDPLQQQLTMNKFHMHPTVFILGCAQFALNIQLQCIHIAQTQQYHFKAPLLAIIQLKLTEINEIKAAIQSSITDVRNKWNDYSVRYIEEMEGYLRELNAHCVNLNQFLQEIPIIGVPITMPLKREEPNSTPNESTRSGRSVHFGDKQQREQSKGCRPLSRQQSKPRDSSRSRSRSRIRKKVQESNGACPICPIFGENANGKKLTFHHLVPLSTLDWFKRKYPNDPLVTNDELDEHGVRICK